MDLATIQAPAVPSILMEEIDFLIGQARAIQISDDATAREAADVLSRMKRTLSAIETKRKEFVGPVNDVVRKINAVFKQPAEIIGAAESRLRNELVRWTRVEEDRKRAEAAAAAAAERKRLLEQAEQMEQMGAVEVADQITAQAISVGEPVHTEKAAPLRTASGSSVITKKRWTYEVLDLAKVPAEYVEIKSAAVRNAISAGVREIPGLRIYQEDEIAIR